MNTETAPLTITYKDIEYTCTINEYEQIVEYWKDGEYVGDLETEDYQAMDQIFIDKHGDPFETEDDYSDDEDFDTPDNFEEEDLVELGRTMDAYERQFYGD